MCPFLCNFKLKYMVVLAEVASNKLPVAKL